MNPENWVSSVKLHTENYTALACHIFDISEPISMIFRRN